MRAFRGLPAGAHRDFPGWDHERAFATMCSQPRTVPGRLVLGASSVSPESTCRFPAARATPSPGRAQPRLARRLRTPQVTGLGLIFGLLLALTAGVETAAGHSALVSSDPPDGAALGVSPGHVRLVFSEPVAASLAVMSVVDQVGRSVPGTMVTADPADPAALIVIVPSLPPGAYRLAWRVVDEVDLHVTGGSAVFGIGQAAPAPGQGPSTATDPAEAFIRWLDLVALSLLGGAFVVLAVVMPRQAKVAGAPVLQPAAGVDLTDPLTRLRRRLLRLATVGAGGGLALGGALLVLQVSAAGSASPVGGVGFPLQRVLATGFGLAWVARELILVALLGLAVFALIGPPSSGWRSVGRQWTGVIACLLLVGLALLQAASGHAALGPEAERSVRTAALAAHLLGAWAWFGGLGALAVTVLPRLRRGGGEMVLARAVLRRFWRIALPSLAVITVTGVYLGGQLVASVDALLQSVYGQALTVKVGLVVLALAIGLRNSASLHPGLRRALRSLLPARLVPAAAGRSTRGVALEATGALAVVLAAAVMASSPPALQAGSGSALGVARQPDITTTVDDLVVTVSIRPGRPGPNFVDVGVLDTRRPAPAPIEQVAVQLQSPDGQTGPPAVAQPLGQSLFELAGRSIAAGPWRVAVIVSRPGLPDARIQVPWTVAPAVTPTSPNRAFLSSQPLAPLTTPLAGLLAALFAVAGGTAFLRRPARSPWREAVGMPRAGIAASARATPGGIDR